MDISVVAPVYNEEGNISTLYGELTEVLDDLGMDYELVFVDDGSTDDSYEEMEKIADSDPRLKVVKLRRNFGQSSALQAGFDTSSGDIVVSIDSDLQNDPRDIPKLLEKLGEGYDCVSGWRHEREDPWRKKFWSAISGWIRRFFLGTTLHDYGCTLKAYRQECLGELKISGEMHRYIPPLLRWRGFDITEVKVNHRAREHGETKYGSKRIFKGFMDMINVWFWQKFHGRPLHLFGGLGLVAIVIGLIGGLVSIYWKIFEGMSLTSTPLPLFAVFMVLIGIQLFVSGLLADILLKNYYSIENKEVYSIEKIKNGKNN